MLQCLPCHTGRPPTRGHRLHYACDQGVPDHDSKRRSLQSVTRPQPWCNSAVGRCRWGGCEIREADSGPWLYLEVERNYWVMQTGGTGERKLGPRGRYRGPHRNHRTAARRLEGDLRVCSSYMELQGELQERWEVMGARWRLEKIYGGRGATRKL